MGNKKAEPGTLALLRNSHQAEQSTMGQRAPARGILRGYTSSVKCLWILSFGRSGAGLIRRRAEDVSRLGRNAWDQIFATTAGTCVAELSRSVTDTDGAKAQTSQVRKAVHGWLVLWFGRVLNRQQLLCRRLLPPRQLELL